MSMCAARSSARFPTTSRSSRVALPPIGTWAPPDKAEDMARLANDGLKELCDKYPDEFAGFVAEVPLTAPDAGVREVGARHQGARRLRRADRHQRQRQAARPRRSSSRSSPRWTQLEQAGVGASDAHRQDAGLRDRGEIALRDLVDLRLVLRHRGLHGAHGVLQDARQVSGPEDHRAPLRRHRADAGRPHRPGLGPDRRAHLGCGLSGADEVAEEAPARLFQAGLLRRHRGVHLGRRDRARA